MPARVGIAYGEGGAIMHLVPHPPQRLPSVARRDLERAWDAAGAAGARPARGLRGFRFARPAAPPTTLLLTDPDAAAWAEAIGGAADFSTGYGVSICLRLLALVELMGREIWLRPWFKPGGGGVRLHPALLQAAALAPLTATGGFAETALRALLPGDFAPGAGPPGLE